MKSTWLGFAVSDSRLYSYKNVTFGAVGISPAFEMFLGDFVIRTSHSSGENSWGLCSTKFITVYFEDVCSEH
jgi:hypothetical protein